MGNQVNFDFDSLEPRVIEGIKYKGREFILREADEAVVINWQNEQASGIKMVDGKVMGMERVANHESILVAGCLREITHTNSGPREKPVTLTEVRTWPHRVVKPLFKSAKEISGLEEDDTIEIVEARIKTDTALLARLKGEAQSDESDKLESDTTASGNS